MNNFAIEHEHVSGEFVSLDGERYYAIHNTDKMAPFFISMVSDSDHWLFASSTGGLTAGRVSPETPLFPYVTVDKIHESTVHTGCKTLVRVLSEARRYEWEPFNLEHDGRYKISRHLYKNLLGNKLCYAETNYDLALVFRYTWMTSQEFGFCRKAELTNIGQAQVDLEVLDGIQNILPAGTPRFTQTQSSNLVDAYKWNEVDNNTGLALYTLYSAITDRAEPQESLRATTVFSLGLEDSKILLSAEQLEAFRMDQPIQSEPFTRGTRGAYLLSSKLQLASDESKSWQIIANLEQSQPQVVSLQKRLESPDVVANEISDSVRKGTDALARLMAASDAFQLTEEEEMSTHHYANTLFNVLRGGIFDDQYRISIGDFAATLKMFNAGVYAQHQDWLASLPNVLNYAELLEQVSHKKDAQLERLTLEYLPITFGRRHGDPSRPWNQFIIKLTDDLGNRLLSYQGNWRDIFQNWEALCLSYPQFIESVVAKFVNASTADGYNPYRVTKEGIDWEVEDPDDPWSYIGYWGDHQIIYLLKMLELSRQFHPEGLGNMLHQANFAYANVPYRLKSFEQMLDDAKNTVLFDEELAEQIDARVADIGADGKLILDEHGQVYQVTLLEKLLVPLLSKLSNLVVDGGIWLNTQRPEWNDANNALVGQGLSMVTLYYLRRYLSFMLELLDAEQNEVVLSTEVNQWLQSTAASFARIKPMLNKQTIDAKLRYDILCELGRAASDYRAKVYQQHGFSGTETQSIEAICQLATDGLSAIDHCIVTNRREDGMYHAYNLLEAGPNGAKVNSLYPMLEGQVAALSSGALPAEEVIDVVQTLFDSDIYRADQKTFMLYPDRELPSFLQKNQVPATSISNIPLLAKMLEANDERIIQSDIDGCYRFHPDLINVGELNQKLSQLESEYPQLISDSVMPLQALYENVFNHKAFTGRSGGMFGFEGLGCIYWHMISKMLLAVQECFFAALEQDTDADKLVKLGKLYYRVREGIGFNKTPDEYGAFPTDPYSHTPKHAGAQQPGMTGQVKEELLTRFGELGMHVKQGAVTFNPALLRRQEFITQANTLRYLDVDENWQELNVADNGLAFTWCQVPVVYQLDDNSQPSLSIDWKGQPSQSIDDLHLAAEYAQEIFKRTGRISKLTLVLNSNMLFEA